MAAKAQTRAKAKTWADVHPFVGELIQGKHDDILGYVEQAVTARRKIAAAQNGFRAGARVSVVETDTKFGGRTGTIARVSPKSMTVNLDCTTCGTRAGAKLPADHEIKYDGTKCGECGDGQWPAQIRASASLLVRA